MKYQAPRGTHDILPGEIGVWQRLEAAALEVFERYGFREIRTPIFESTDLFARGVGASTDIVRKEMYTFASGDDSVTLRPEMTASVIRAHVQHGLSRAPGHERLFYIGPMFRRERPQKGRQRQFHQVGVEVLGADDPYVDAEGIQMLMAFLGSVLGTAQAGGPESSGETRRGGAAGPAGWPQGIRLELNSVGCSDCRSAYREALRAWLAVGGASSGARLESLCEDCGRRLVENPLRVFDCKVPADRALLEEAPVMMDHLDEGCRAHFQAVQGHLRTLDVPFRPAPRLVRGLDYYVRTAFELVAEEGLGAQNSLMGGGRYDGLMKALGGPDLPGFGWALGLERLILLLETTGGVASEARRADLFLAHLGEAARAFSIVLARDLRAAGVSVRIDPRPRALAAQLRQADREGARWALIVGDDEMRSGMYPLKDMVSQDQTPLGAVSPADLAARVAERMGARRA